MNKTVVIHQPDFLPHIGFFHRFLRADLWIILDHVQFVNKGNSWHYRDRIKTPNGAQWLSLSVKKTPVATPINEVLLTDTINWREKNLNLIRQNYSKAPFYNEIFPKIEQLYRFQCVKMLDFNMKSIEMLMALFNINVEKIFSNQLKPEGKKNELLINILKKVNAGVYLSGTGAKDYMDTGLFSKEGIEVVYQEFTHPVYPQLHGDFISYLSSIDILLNCGIEESRKIIRNL